MDFRAKTRKNTVALSEAKKSVPQQKPTAVQNDHGRELPADDAQ
jgi:hypothetical protein